MSAQFYVSPEQLMKDRADFARKGIARGRSVIVASCRDGIALIAENPSRTLRKIGEIYDRIAFAAVGKYNEFESLRQAGVRYADTRGYSYDREDVTGRGLASVYAQSLGSVFTADTKPFEVELAVAEVGEDPATDQVYRVNFDGSISDEPGILVMGGDATALATALDTAWSGRNLSAAGFGDVIRSAAHALPHLAGTPTADLLEVAVLDRTPRTASGTRRTFRRYGKDEVVQTLAGEDGA
ncbi:proteasome subunit alpha [Arthrobacter sp.]|uniref:proteasome subunit alpha n=1 Tax=Arthrobacter sp. TaxID=1667 RepID=UPI003A8F964E